MSQIESHDVDVAAPAPQGFSAGAGFLAGDILPREWSARSGTPMMAAAKKKKPAKKKAPAKKKPARPKPTKGPGCVTEGSKCKSSTGTC